MSKRRRRERKANLPEATLARARELAKQEAEEDADAPDARATAEADEAAAGSPPAATMVEETEAEETDEAPPDAARGRQRSPALSARQRTRRHATRARVDEVDAEKLDNAAIKALLLHPTKTVTEDELHHQYGYVLADLKSMGILAAVLVIVLIAVNLIFL